MAEKPTYEELEQRLKELEAERREYKRSFDVQTHQKIPVNLPLKDDSDITFEDLFDIADIQRIQDQFAKVTGVASIITHTDGTPITTPSNFCRLCKDIIRKTEKGLNNCFRSDAVLGRFHPGGPIIQQCMSGGLWDAGAGITVGGRHIANWLIGQVRDASQNEEKILAYAREIGADEKSALEAFHEVSTMTREQFEEISTFLFTLASQLSANAYQNVQQTRYIAERQQAERAVVKSERKLRATLDATPFPVAVADLADDKMLYWSRSALALFGHTASTAAEWYRMVYPDPVYRQESIERFEHFLEKARASGQPVNAGEYLITCKDGSIRTCQLYATFIIDSLIITFNDITERRNAERELQEKEDTLKSIFVSAPIGIGMLVDRIINWVNPQLCTMIGYDRDELLHQSSRLIYPDQKQFELVGREIYRQISENGIGTVETCWRRKDGGIIDVMLSATPLDQADWSKGVTFTGLDISQRKQDEKALLESEQRFRSAFHTSPDAIAINMIADGRYLDINQGFSKLLGYTGEELVGRSSLELNIWKDPDDRKRLVEGLLQKGYVENLEAQFVRKDGKTIFGLMSASIMRVKDEAVILSVSRDITERKHIENELVKYREHLEDLVKKRTAALAAKNKELEMFTYSVSHDLKAPLRGIDGYSRLLQEDYADKLDEEGLLFLKNVRQSTAQMNQLIEDLLAYSRMERRDIQPESLDIRAMVDILISQRSHDIEARRTAIRVDLPFERIYSDPETMRQVLTNYLDNAVKFSSQDDGVATIEIGGSEDPDAWTLWVKDNGIGFDQKYGDRIFEIFQRLHRAEDFPGTGIGLAIACKAVGRIGGRVLAKSFPGQGATFFIAIPKTWISSSKENDGDESQ